MKIFSPAIFVSISGFFIFDRFLKWQALHGWNEDYLLNKHFGWHPFLNPGVAFGVPVPSWLIIVLTIPILVLLIYHVSRLTYQARMLHVTCYVLIIAGALSNFIDRLLYNHTVDYILISTGVINLADILIVAGFVIYLLRRTRIGTNGYE